MDEIVPTVLSSVATELKERLADFDNEPMPAKITAMLFAVHKSEADAGHRGSGKT